MYLTANGGYYKSTDQHARRAEFLILMQPDTLDGHRAPIRAIVRSVALRQCGHWMMGSARVAGERIPISGAYGADGLPCSVPMVLYLRGIEIPPELHAAWNSGGGWNSAGSEASAMREWALANIKLLRPKRN